jgi:hypothetical protein
LTVATTNVAKLPENTSCRLTPDALTTTTAGSVGYKSAQCANLISPGHCHTPSKWPKTLRNGGSWNGFYAPRWTALTANGSQQEAEPL